MICVVAATRTTGCCCRNVSTTTRIRLLPSLSLSLCVCVSVYHHLFSSRCCCCCCCCCSFVKQQFSSHRSVPQHPSQSDTHTHTHSITIRLDGHERADHQSPIHTLSETFFVWLSFISPVLGFIGHSSPTKNHDDIDAS